MKELLMNYLNQVVLEQLSKAELIKKVMELQERDKVLTDKLTEFYNSKREADKNHKEDIKEYKKRMEELIKELTQYQVESEHYKRIADLKLGNSYNLNSTWIDKIVFVLKEAGRPLRSSEIIEVLKRNDIKFRVLTDHQKGLSAHLTKAMKYGRIVGTKQKGQNGYVFELPSEK